MKGFLMPKITSEKDIDLLIALHENPMIRFIDLAKILGITPKTAANRYRYISENTVNRVIADLNVNKLELEIVDIIVEVNSEENSCKMEKFCDDHPYTLYRSRIFGKINGLFLQFRIPRGTKRILNDQMENLKKKQIVVNYEIIEHKFIQIKTSMKFNSWTKSYHWIFNWDKWEQKFSEIFNSSENILSKFKTKFEDSILKNLDGLDLLILEELTKGCARRKNIEIIKDIEEQLPKNSHYLPISKQTFSRRLKFLKENAIQGYRLFFDWQTFDIHHSVSIICQTSSKIISSLYKILSSEPFPFESNFRAISEETFIWYLRIPAEHLFNLYDFLWKRVKKLDFYTFHYKSSQHYGLWHKTFFENSHQWNLNY